MTESKAINLSTIIGFFPLCNLGAILVHAIDYAEDKVLASVNGIEPQWCDMTEEYRETSEELELGFNLGSIFCPFSEVMRFEGGAE